MAIATVTRALVLGLVFATVSALNPEEAGNYMEGDIVGVAPGLLPGKTRAGMIDTRYRWPNNTIPYEFDKTYPADLQTLFRSATQHISSQTCIKFIPRTTQKDYISIIPGSGCYSYVGRVGGKQDVSLPKACNRLGIFVHELIHSIGFQHEQSRTDRDDFVTIKKENIRAGTELNFDKYGSNLISAFGVKYDYGSVMHYPSTAFSVNGKETIVPKQAGAQIGQRVGMSATDATKINNMYNCKMGKSEGEVAADAVRQTLKLF